MTVFPFFRIAAAGCVLAAAGASSLLASDTDAVTGASANYSGRTYAIDGQPFSIDRVFAPDSRTLELANELELSLEQQDRIKLVMYELEPRWRALVENGRALREKLREASPGDEHFALVTAEASTVAASNAAELINLIAEMRVSAHTILTDAQRDRLKAIAAEKRAEHEAKMQTKYGDTAGTEPAQAE